jgi:hypothetical protein
MGFGLAEALGFLFLFFGQLALALGEGVIRFAHGCS